MKTLKLSILFIVLLFSTSAFAVSAKDLAKFTPDKIGDFTATETATIQDINKANGMLHRVQRAYKSDKGLMCVIAIIEGAEVTNNIKAIFSKEGKKTMIGNFEVIQMTPKDNQFMVQSSVKLSKQCLLTVVVLNTNDINVPIKIIKKINLNDLAKIVAENDASKSVF
ncbi:MAG: hypothetical protein ABFD50_01440 [Smithella sp.]